MLIAEAGDLRAAFSVLEYGRRLNKDCLLIHICSRTL
jgi:hypothetical protein